MRKLFSDSRHLSVLLTLLLFFLSANVKALDIVPLDQSLNETADLTQSEGDDGIVDDELADLPADGMRSILVGPPHAIQQDFISYSTHPIVEHMLAAAYEQIRANPDEYIARAGTRYRDSRGRVRVRRRTVTYCYRAVKDAMRESGMVPREFRGQDEAHEAKVDLLGSDYGFRDLLSDPNYRNLMYNNPRMAPKGALLIYRTVGTAPPNVSRAGHIEIKTVEAGIDGYIAVAERFVPTYPRLMPQERELIAVLVKDDPGSAPWLMPSLIAN